MKLIFMKFWKKIICCEYFIMCMMLNDYDKRIGVKLIDGYCKIL